MVTGLGVNYLSLLPRANRIVIQTSLCAVIYHKKGRKHGDSKGKPNGQITHYFLWRIVLYYFSVKKNNIYHRFAFKVLQSAFMTAKTIQTELQKPVFTTRTIQIPDTMLIFVVTPGLLAWGFPTRTKERSCQEQCRYARNILVRKKNWLLSIFHTTCIMSWVTVTYLFLAEWARETQRWRWRAPERRWKMSWTRIQAPTVKTRKVIRTHPLQTRSSRSPLGITCNVSTKAMDISVDLKWTHLFAVVLSHFLLNIKMPFL